MSDVPDTFTTMFGLKVICSPAVPPGFIIVGEHLFRLLKDGVADCGNVKDLLKMVEGKV